MATKKKSAATNTYTVTIPAGYNGVPGYEQHETLARWVAYEFGKDATVEAV